MDDFRETHKENFFISARVNKLNNQIECSVESYICFLVYAYCDFQFDISIVDDSDYYDCSLGADVLKNIKYHCISKTDSKYQQLALTLPAIQSEIGQTNVAGLCAVLRFAIKLHVSKCLTHFSQTLLGFRGGCLVSCTESSMWTKFCELQMPNSVRELKALMNGNNKSTRIPDSLVLLESHLKRPVRTHNILKRKLDVVKKAKLKAKDNNAAEGNVTDVGSEDINFTVYDSDSKPLSHNDVSEALEKLVINEKSQDFSLDHNYLEGIDLTLADLIVFPCVHHLLNHLSPNAWKHLENVLKWYKRMCLNSFLLKAMKICKLEIINTAQEVEVIEHITIPVVDKDSLYKRDPTYTRLRVKQKTPSNVLAILKNASISPEYTSGFCESLDWDNLPDALHPLTGDLPQSRIDRKCQQIESMVTAALKVAIDGQTIVEFCAGGGHVGLLLAYFLPKCKVILIENKESSISRAKNRAEILNLKNIYFYQCNLDYFRGSFDLGISLHACGVATDLVIHQCIKEGASFVCCPCCYGGIQNTHLLTYPLSKTFCSTVLSYEQYTLLAHCADRNEINTPTADQGELCMGLIDTDRVLFGEECGYEVQLTTLQPLTCSPKHNLLIGISPKLRTTNIC